MQNITKISELNPVIEEIVTGILSDTYITYASDGLGYTPTRTEQEEVALDNMSIEEYEQFKAEHPERQIYIKNVITPENCEIAEIITRTIEQSRTEFLAENIVNTIRQYMTGAISRGMQIEAERTLNNDLKNVL